MNHLFSNLQSPISTWRDRPALIDGEHDSHLSYGDLSEMINVFGELLKRNDIHGDDRITIISQSSYYQALAIIACLCSGVIANPLSHLLTESLMTEFITHANPSLILTDVPSQLPEGLRRSQSILSIENALTGDTGIRAYNHPALNGGLLIYTSGTTGNAKGVLLSTENIEANVATAATIFGYEPGWVSACLLPLYHTFGIISDILPILLTGGTAVILPTFEMGHVKATLESFRRYKVNSYSAPPVIFEAFLALDCLTNTHLRFAIAGAAPLREATRIEYERRFGHPIIPCYGLSEATCFATISPPSAIRRGSVGRAANIEICVRDEHGTPLAANQIGEIALRGQSVIRHHYYRDEGRYASSFTEDGWFLTGDLGRIDENNYVYVSGRKKNMVIRGGHKVYLEDIDRSLAQCPGVIDCASIVISEEEKSDLSVCFVVPDEAEAVTREAITAHIRNYLGSRHVPDVIVFTQAIPRTPTGKSKHTQMRALYESVKHNDY